MSKSNQNDASPNPERSVRGNIDEEGAAMVEMSFDDSDRILKAKKESGQSASRGKVNDATDQGFAIELRNSLDQLR